MSGQVKLSEIADMKGLSQPYFFAMDTKTKPDKVICHFVRMETIEFTNDATFDATTLTTLHPDNDKRLRVLAQCFGSD